MVNSEEKLFATTKILMNAFIRWEGVASFRGDGTQHKLNHAKAIVSGRERHMGLAGDLIWKF